MNVGTVLGPYELGEQLGQGTWGLSYRARRADGTDYPLPGSTAEAPAWPWVVKVIPTSADRSLALRVRSCAKAWSCLGHPGILVPTEILEDGESVALVYEFQVRGSLAGARGSLAGARGSLAGAWGPEWIAGRDDARALKSVLCDALITAHSEGLIHGDVKADNILLDLGGTALLVDAGFAGVLRAGEVGGRAQDIRAARDDLLALDKLWPELGAGFGTTAPLLRRRAHAWRP